MATNHEESVETTLMEHLATLITTPATTIAEPDWPFTGSPPYLRANIIPTRSGAITESGGMKRHAGILQIDVVTERNKGRLTAIQIIDQVCQHFRMGVLIWGSDGRNIQIIEPPVPQAPFYDENETVTPVDIYYSSFSTVSTA